MKGSWVQYVFLISWLFLVLSSPPFVWGARRAWERGYSSNWYNCERVMHTFLLTTGVEATWLQDVVVVLHQFDTNTSHSNHHTYNAHIQCTHTHTHTTTLPCVIPTLLFWLTSVTDLYVLWNYTKWQHCVQNNSLPYWCMLLRKPSFVEHCFQALKIPVICIHNCNLWPNSYSFAVLETRVGYKGRAEDCLFQNSTRRLLSRIH